MNAYQQALIDNPPPKNPYFTLPDVSNFLTEEDLSREAKLNSSQYNSLIELFGHLDKMSDDQQTQFLLQILKHCTQFKPDFEAVAGALSIANSNHVARRFKTILQKQGFTFDEIGNQVIGQGLLPEGSKVAKTPADGKREAATDVASGKTAQNKKRAYRRRSKCTNGGESHATVMAKKKPRLGLVSKLSEEVVMSESEEDADFEQET